MAAVTVAAVTDGDFNLAPGLKVKFLTVTMTGDYNTLASGGMLADVSAYFPTAVLGAQSVSDTDGWSLSYELASAGDPATGVILARNVTSTLDLALMPECAANTNLTGVVGRFMFVGY